MLAMLHCTKTAVLSIYGEVGINPTKDVKIFMAKSIKLYSKIYIYIF